MRATLAPYVTTGVALLTVGAVTVVPLEPTTDIAVRASHEVVELTADPSVLDVYGGLITRSLENLGDRARDAAPAIGRLIEYPIGVATDVATAVESGDVELLVATVAKAVAQPASAVITAPVTFVTDYAASMAVALVVWPVVNAALGTVYAVRDVLEALADADLVDLLNAVVTIPGKVIHAVVNGVVDWEDPDGSGFTGLLTEGPTDPIGGNFLKGPLYQAATFLDDVVPAWTTPGTSTPPGDSTVGEVPDLGAPGVPLRTLVDPPAGADDETPSDDVASDDVPSAEDDAAASDAAEPTEGPAAGEGGEDPGTETEVEPETEAVTEAVTEPGGDRDTDRDRLEDRDEADRGSDGANAEAGTDDDGARPDRPTTSKTDASGK
ncbi:hypothetical protein [Mycolicibacterium sp.]|uniref:hypothetical protein n=1 Tax=Mycolicibacterium sp. TaxID=2320850 RepID=UPI003D117C22